MGTHADTALGPRIARMRNAQLPPQVRADDDGEDDMAHPLIIDAIRTPMGRGKPGGALSQVHPVDLLGRPASAADHRNDVDPGTVDDVIVGCVSQVGEQAGSPGRMAWLSAGFPEHVPATTVDRRCGSSQQAVHFAAQGIAAGAYDLADRRRGGIHEPRADVFGAHRSSTLWRSIAGPHIRTVSSPKGSRPSALPRAGRSRAISWTNFPPNRIAVRLRPGHDGAFRTK